MAQAYALKGDAAKRGPPPKRRERRSRNSSAQTPDDDQRHVLLGLSLAYLGRKEEAIREAKRELVSHAQGCVHRGPTTSTELARIYMLVGEPEKALDKLEPLLKIPYFLSPGWLRIDPNFDPLRDNPRFQKLAAGK